jgi:CheY-like chemotaxis protein
VTLEAQDGAQALGMFDAALPDLVLLDVMMPGLSGFEVCEQIRARPNGALVPIIMLTGLDDGDSVQRAFDVGPPTSSPSRSTGPCCVSAFVTYCVRPRS